MKKNMAMGLVMALAASASGCASEAERIVAYNAYLQAHREAVQAQKEAPPLVKIKIDPQTGALEELVVNQQQQVIEPQQIKNNEELAFWGQILGATIPTVATLGSSWISGHYNYKNNQAMWAALGQGGLGGGIEVGGNAVITGSGNRAEIAGYDGSATYMADFMNSPSVPGNESSLPTGGGGVLNEAAPEAPAE